MKFRKMWGSSLVGLLIMGCVTGASLKKYQESIPDPRGSLLDFAIPVEDISPKAISLFGWRTSRRLHEGLDFRAPMRTPVLASERGAVLYVGQSLRGYGLIVVINHGDGWSTVYAHLSRSLVKRGDLVHKGQRIAYSGNSGRSSGPHLHFEIRKGADPLDPLLFLPRARLRLP
jgi:murein DD-endopeptidase MepM/ murein hydrolase activator NlpD